MLACPVVFDCLLVWLRGYMCLSVCLSFSMCCLCLSFLVVRLSVVCSLLAWLLASCVRLLACLFVVCLPVRCLPALSVRLFALC